MQKPTRKKVIGCSGCLVAFVIFLIVPPFGIVTFGLYHGFTQRHLLDSAIENDLPDIAKACISLTQQLPKEDGVIFLAQEDPRMPDVLKRTKCSHMGVKKNKVEIEMHGGFDHFGLRLQQEDANSNIWNVLRYWEGGEEHLITITNEQRASNQ